MQELYITAAHAEHMLIRALNQRTYTEHMPSMALQAADFDNLAVANAINPTPNIGWHYSEHMHNAF